MLNNGSGSSNEQSKGLKPNEGDVFEFETIRLQYKDMPGDGNCFFHSVAASLNAHRLRGRNDWNHEELRTMGVRYLTENPDFMLRLDEDREAYIASMERDREYARDEIIPAVGLALGVQVHVMIREEQTPDHLIDVNSYPGPPSRDAIYVLYNGTNHYDALLPIGTALDGKGKTSLFYYEAGLLANCV